MYKLSVYIYLNHVPFDARQKSYEFKSLVKFGSSQKNFKIRMLGLFLENHSKSNFLIRIPLYANLGFHKKMPFLQICSDGHMRAKQVPRASESSAVYANQAIKNGLSERSELRQRVSLAHSSQIKQSQQLSKQPTNKPTNKPTKQVK